MRTLPLIDSPIGWSTTTCAKTPRRSINGMSQPVTRSRVVIVNSDMANIDPMGITAGPDGNLWFTGAGSDKIGRITTSGAVTEFQIP
jgi:hypothetical protein